LLDDLSLQELLETQDYFGLPSPALVEKDIHVVKALAAITAIPIAPLQLVFGGGTALSRAHRLIRRMSEDIDLKIAAAVPPTRPALRQLREAITDALLTAGFDFDPSNRGHRDSNNESRYTIFRLPYKARAAGEGALRPEIQIETALWPVRLPTVERPVISFLAEAFKRPPEIAKIACVSITETAAEKFVALTRRIGVERAHGGPPDTTLVRHIYDLHVIRTHYHPAEVAALIPSIMQSDAQAFGNQFPAYRDNPMDETRRALHALEFDPTYVRRFADFCRLMVYGDPVEYAACIDTLKELATQI
jgi:hypothetical protein